MIIDSVYAVIERAKEPLSFDVIAERVQGIHPEVTRPQIAGELGNLIVRQRVYLNQDKTGFVATRSRRDSERMLENAVKQATPASMVNFG